MNIVAAIGKNREIGKNNDLLWHMPADMYYFKQLTLGHIVIMGRKNYESIPSKYRPLSKRINIILTKKKYKYSEDDVFAVNSFESCMQIIKNHPSKKKFIIGGGEIYKQALDKNLVDTLYITRIESFFEATVFFPEIDLKKWQLISRKKFEKDNNNPFDYSFCVYKKV